jgi:hypothetical protein
VVIKIFFTALVLCTVAVVAVCLGVHLRVKRHLRQQQGSPGGPDSEGAEAGIGLPERPSKENVAGAGAKENRAG